MKLINIEECKVIGEHLTDAYDLEEALIAYDFHLCRDYRDPEIVMAVKDGKFDYAQSFRLVADDWQFSTHRGPLSKDARRK
jgi:hypothetical protein